MSGQGQQDQGLFLARRRRRRVGVVDLLSDAVKASTQDWLFGAAAGGSSGPVGLATETDAAFALGSARPVALSSETDTALALTGRQLRTVGRADETDTAFALTAPAGSAVGRADEVDAAFALGAARPAGLASETDAALSLAGLQLRAVGRSDEADTALALQGVSIRAVGLATETDTSFALAAVQALAVGRADETDTALALSPGAQSGPVGVALEVDEAFALSASSVGAGSPHGFEMGGDEPPQSKRRSLVYVVQDGGDRSSAAQRPAIATAEARAQAMAIIKAAATEHAATRVSKDVRFGNVRASLKPIEKSIGGFDWVSFYKKAYDNALLEQLKIQEQIADQLEEDSAIAFLLLNM